MNKPVQAMFRVGPTPPEGLFIRALPIYAVAGHISEPVTRCPNHASLEDSTNRAFNKVIYLLSQSNWPRYISIRAVIK